MAVYTELPSKGLDMSDVVDTLRANGGHVGTMTTLYMPEAKVNPWSAHKPVYDPYVTAGEEPNWKGIYGKCGFIINVVPNWMKIEEEYNAKTSWVYEDLDTLNRVPSPYADTVARRLGDFRGYYAAASSPILKKVFPTLVNTDHVLFYTIELKDPINNKELNLADFDIRYDLEHTINLAGCHLSFRIRRKEDTVGVHAKLVRAELPISRGGLRVEMPASELEVGDYVFTPFLSHPAEPFNICIPGEEVHEIRVMLIMPKIYIESDYSQNLMDIEVRCTMSEFSNPQFNGYTFRQNTIQLRYLDSKPEDPVSGNERIDSMLDWTPNYDVPLSLIMLYTFKSVDVDFKGGTYKIVLSLDDGKYIYEAEKR